ncbi:MAG: DUF4012 domain-containing protein [Patescibacteria group bacterium]
MARKRKNIQNIESEDMGVPANNVVDLRNSGGISRSDIIPDEAEEILSEPEYIAAPEPKRLADADEPSIRHQSPPPVKPIINKRKKNNKNDQTLNDRLEKYWWRYDWRAVAVFAVMVLVIGGIFGGTQVWGQLSQARGVVLGASTEAYDYLQSAQGAVDQFSLGQATAEFHKAEASFAQAENELAQLPGWLMSIIKLIPGPGQTVASGEHLIKAGRYISQAGESLTRVMQQFSTEQTAITDNTESIELMPLISALEGDLSQAIEAAQLASDELLKVKVDHIPAEYRGQIAVVKDKLPAVTDELNSISSVVELLSSVLGTTKAQEYLLVFQNNNELRATGGFIGSLAQVAVKRGKLTVVEVPGRGAYEINDDFDKRLIPPKPLQLINDQWQIQDANWWPDWPSSAEKIIWFYEEARGFPLQGIISLTPDIIIELLDITGPVDMTEKYGTEVNSDNFLTLTQDIDYAKQENRPKAIIADLMPEVISRLLTIEPAKLIDTLGVINRALAKKNMLFYFSDDSKQAIAERLGWSGEVRDNPFDYLSVIHTNIGGGKTDLVVKTEIEHNAEIQSDGSIIDTVTIVKRHNGDINDPLTKIKNMDYLRIMVPAGSQLLDAYGFEIIDRSLLLSPLPEAVEDADLARLESDVIVHESSGTRIYDQFDKTVFANWLGVAVGQTALATITYKLPQKISQDQSYRVLFQKQSGTAGDEITSHLTWPANYSVSTYAPDQAVEVLSDSLRFKSVLDVDKAWGAMLEKHED